MIYDNYKYSDPNVTSLSPKPTTTSTIISPAYMSSILNNNYYAIFYPTAADISLMRGVPNQWQAKWCKFTKII